jgi:hypothetical protein
MLSLRAERAGGGGEEAGRFMSELAARDERDERARRAEGDRARAMADEMSKLRQALEGADAMRRESNETLRDVQLEAEQRRTEAFAASPSSGRGGAARDSKGPHQSSPGAARSSHRSDQPDRESDGAPGARSGVQKLVTCIVAEEDRLDLSGLEAADSTPPERGELDNVERERRVLFTPSRLGDTSSVLQGAPAPIVAHGNASVSGTRYASISLRVEPGGRRVGARRERADLLRRFSSQAGSERAGRTNAGAAEREAGRRAGSAPQGALESQPFSVRPLAAGRPLPRTPSAAATNPRLACCFKQRS